MVENHKSPRTLTGGQAVHTTTPTKAVVDWVQATFKGKKIWSEMLMILGLEKVEFNKFEKAFYGYQHMYGMNNINIMYYDAMDEYHVQMTGSGCRMFEQISEIDWQELFTYIHHDEQAKLTRLDLALDSFDKPFTIPTIEGKCERGELVTKFREGQATKKWKFSTENLGPSENAGYGLEFGARASRLMVRMYDKKLERENKGLEVTVDDWLRVELQFRKEYSNDVLAELVENGFQLGITAKGYLKEYMRFVNRGKDTNKRRWKESLFWVKYLKHIEPLKLSLDAPDQTIEKKIKWLDHSIAPTLATVLQAKGKPFMDRYIDELYQQGETRMKPKHVAMVNDHKQAEELAKISNLVGWEFAKNKQKEEREAKKNEMNEMNEKKKKALSREEKMLSKKMNEDKLQMNEQNLLHYMNEYSMKSEFREETEYNSVLKDRRLEPRIKFLPVDES